MIISNDSWATAQAMFEGGASLAEISTKTAIDRSSVSKKAKKLGWVKGKNQQLILDAARVTAERSTLNAQQGDYHDFQVSFHVGLMFDLEIFSNSVMKKANNLIDSAETGSDFKAIVEGVDRLTILTRFNDRHSKPVQPQQNTQQVSEVVFTRAFQVVE